MSYIFLFFQWFKILSREICTIIYSTKTYSTNNLNLDFVQKNQVHVHIISTATYTQNIRILCIFLNTFHIYNLSTILAQLKRIIWSTTKK